IVETGAVLALASDLALEPVTLNGNGPSDRVVAGPILETPTLNGHATGALRNLSGNNTYTGTLTLATPVVTIGVNDNSSLTIANPTLWPAATVSGGNLVKELAGTLILKTANTYGGGSFSIPTDIDPAIPGSPRTWAGGTLVAQGILNVQNSTALGPIANTTTVLDGAQLQVQGGTAANPVVIGSKVQLSGTGNNVTGALQNAGGVNVWSGQVILAQDPAFLPVTN